MFVVAQNVQKLMLDHPLRIPAFCFGTLTSSWLQVDAVWLKLWIPGFLASWLLAFVAFGFCGFLAFGFLASWLLAFGFLAFGFWLLGFWLLGFWLLWLLGFWLLWLLGFWLLWLLWLLGFLAFGFCGFCGFLASWLLGFCGFCGFWLLASVASWLLASVASWLFCFWLLASVTFGFCGFHGFLASWLLVSWLLGFLAFSCWLIAWLLYAFGFLWLLWLTRTTTRTTRRTRTRTRTWRKKKETRQGGTDIFSTVCNNNLFIVPFIFPVVCPPSLFHSKGRANANNTCKKATILIAMQQKLQTTVFSTITLCQSTNAHKQRRATWNALRGEALRPPPAPPTRLFFMVGPRLLLHVATARQQHHWQA